MTIHVTPIPKLIELVAPAYTLGTSNTAGAATTAVPSNSTLLVYDTTVPVVSTFGGSSAVGSAATASRRDHKHGLGAHPATSSTVVAATRAGSAGAGDQAITGAGFEPTTVFIFNSPSGGGSLSWGFGDDALGQGVIYTGLTAHAGSYIVYNTNADSSNVYVAVLKSLDADGCTLTWSNLAGGGHDCQMELLFLR